MPTPTHTNRLAREKSPYLLQHQHNPVDWFAWGEEAFEKARKEDKPIFLSVGYSTCHWCHVMEHESFENEAVAAVMNEHFVNIKVDREERPDVDRVYMTYVQATTGSGGWPMSVFLTPDLKPFVGGTYFPPEDRYGRVGFKTVLLRVAETWKKDRKGVIAHGEEVIRLLSEQAAASSADASKLVTEGSKNAFEHMVQTFDSDEGGFGRAPKFPRPASLHFLLRIFARETRGASEPGNYSRDAKLAIGMANLTLQKMADGGMYDHLGGGFHRYSVDHLWHVPHYEKMLYDQAQLVAAYVEAFQATGDHRFSEIARETLAYIQRDMTHPQGGFFSAEDADSLPTADAKHKTEGAFYVWEKAEIAAALSAEDAALFDRVYGVEEAGNSPEGSDPHGELKGKNTLIRRLTDEKAAKELQLEKAAVETRLAAARRTLFELRAKRPRPHLDDKVIAAWNGLMISGLAKASQVLGDPKHLEAGQRAARFLRENLWKNGALIRSWREGASQIPGFADDYAFVIQGLLDLYEADFDVAWLAWAGELQEKMDSLFLDEKGAGYWSTSGTDPSVLIRIKDDYDSAEPTASSVAASNLVRLAAILNKPEYATRAAGMARGFADRLEKSPGALPQLLASLELSLGKVRQVVIAGDPQGADTRALIAAARSGFAPNQIVLLADGGASSQWLAARVESIGAMKPVGGKAAAYVCENFTCKAPVTDPGELEKALGF